MSPVESISQLPVCRNWEADFRIARDSLATASPGKSTGRRLLGRGRDASHLMAYRTGPHVEDCWKKRMPGT